MLGVRRLICLSVCLSPAGSEDVLPEALRRPVAAAGVSQVGEHAAAEEGKAPWRPLTGLSLRVLALTSSVLVSVLQDPFPGVSASYKQALGEDERRLLTAFFAKNSADTFLLEMHEFLVLVLKKNNTDDFKTDWG